MNNAEFLQWETKSGGAKFSSKGIIPVAINGSVYFGTQLSISKDVNRQQIGNDLLTTGSMIDASMCLFCQPEFPELSDQSDIPQTVSIDMVIGDCMVRADNVIFSKVEKLNNYEKCDAAYTEWVAEGISMERSAQTISNRITANSI